MKPDFDLDERATDILLRHSVPTTASCGACGDDPLAACPVCQVEPARAAFNALYPEPVTTYYAVPASDAQTSRLDLEDDETTVEDVVAHLPMIDMRAADLGQRAELQNVVEHFEIVCHDLEQKRRQKYDVQARTRGALREADVVIDDLHRTHRCAGRWTCGVCSLVTEYRDNNRVEREAAFDAFVADEKREAI